MFIFVFMFFGLLNSYIQLSILCVRVKVKEDESSERVRVRVNEDKGNGRFGVLGRGGSERERESIESEYCIVEKSGVERRRVGRSRVKITIRVCEREEGEVS